MGGEAGVGRIDKIFDVIEHTFNGLTKVVSAQSTIELPKTAFFEFETLPQSDKAELVEVITNFLFDNGWHIVRVFDKEAIKVLARYA